MFQPTRYGKRVIWITGFSGSGKTTLALSLQNRFRENGIEAILLDGDRLRSIFAPDAGFENADRRRLAMSYARLCAELSNQGFVVICATISMFHDVRTWNRENISGYREVYLRVPRDERARRDAKGLYAAGAANMVDLDLQAEEPREPDLMIDNFGANTSMSTLLTLWNFLVDGDAELQQSLIRPARVGERA